MGADRIEGAAIADLERLAESGDGAAARKLADLYLSGSVVPRNLDVALRSYERGAQLGNADAQNSLGSMLLNGIACERDPAKAVHWYRISAGQGNPEAQFNIGKCYLCGDGVDRDFLEARKWFEKAGVGSHGGALRELGTMFRLGQGVQPNLLAAADFHLVAAELGDGAARSNLSQYRAELEEIAFSGSQMAGLFLSRMSNRGFGADKSQPMTWAWISWAKKHCVPDADAEIAGEVNRAYAFYHMSIPAEERKQGQKILAGLRQAIVKVKAADRISEAGRPKRRR